MRERESKMRKMERESERERKRKRENDTATHTHTRTPTRTRTRTHTHTQVLYIHQGFCSAGGGGGMPPFDVVPEPQTRRLSQQAEMDWMEEAAAVLPLRPSDRIQLTFRHRTHTPY